MDTQFGHRLPDRIRLRVVIGRPAVTRQDNPLADMNRYNE